jgi:hypothetical protein
MGLAGPAFSFEGELFEAAAASAWVFVAVPVSNAEEIRNLAPPRTGFGSVTVFARIGSTRWGTSIFPSKETQSYVLPVKKAVRDAEQIEPET